MTWEEFKTHTMPLAVQIGAAWDLPTWKLYHRAVADVSLALYLRALMKAAQTRTTMPSAAQMRDFAEGERKALLEAHPYEACADCNHVGTVRVGNVSIESGHRRPLYTKCKCWHQYQERLNQLGITTAPLALPAAEPREFVQAGQIEPETA